MQSLGPSFNRAAARLADRIHRPPVRGVGDAGEVLYPAGTGGAASPAAIPLVGSRGIKLVAILAAVVLPFGIYAFAGSGQEPVGEDRRAAAPASAGAGGGEGSGDGGLGETGLALPERSPSPEPSDAGAQTEPLLSREELDRESSNKAAARPRTSRPGGSRASGSRLDTARSAAPPVIPAVAPPAASVPAATVPAQPQPQVQSVACVVASTFVLHGGEVTERGELVCSDGTRRPLEPAGAAPAPVPPKAHCEDGVDNDSDGLVDRQDPGCETLADSSEVDPAPPPPTPQCSDGKDNDGDGAVDGYDPGCADPAGESETNPALPAKAVCADGIDNDDDGYIDLADPGRLAAEDLDELPVNAAPACKDGMDNDADGFVDLRDPGCGNPNGHNEGDPAPTQPARSLVGY